MIGSKIVVASHVLICVCEGEGERERECVRERVSEWEGESRRETAR